MPMPASEHAQTVVNVAAGIAVALLVVRWIDYKIRPQISGANAPSGVTAKKRTHNAPKKAWVLVVTSKFRSLVDRDALLEYIRPIAYHAARHESGTLGFQVAVADNDPLKILVFERFATKEAWSEAHRNSTVYKAYKSWQSASGIQVETTGQSYDEMNFGYLLESERSWRVEHGSEHVACDK